MLGLFDAAHVADDVEAADAGHADVEEEQADLAAQDFLQGFVAAGGAAQVVAERGQGAFQGVQRVLVVVDDEDLGIRRHGPDVPSLGRQAYVRTELTGSSRGLTRSAQRRMPHFGAHGREGGPTAACDAGPPVAGCGSLPVRRSVGRCVVRDASRGGG